MQNMTRRHPALSSVVCLASLLGIPLGQALYQHYGNIGNQTALFLALGLAVAGAILGVAGLIATREDPFAQRVPAVIGIVLGGILALCYGFVLFLLFTPNAPF